MTHEQLISYCTQWFWNEFPDERRMLYAIDNNSYDRIEGAKKKALGVVKGVFDLCYLLPNQTVYLDGKVGYDKLSPEQLDFKEKAEDRGCICTTFSTPEEFKKLIYEFQRIFMI